VPRAGGLRARFIRAFSGGNRILYEISGGALGSRFGGAPVLLLTTTGRKTGMPRTTPLLFLADTNDYILVASNGGSPRNPGWFLNLQANPAVEVHVKRDRKPMRARIAFPAERERLWERVVAMYPGYAKYQQRTSREIPIVILEPRSLTPPVTRAARP
jgi:deazaflavin-dependent oxidoreductase (nitroreductase family)